MSKDYDKIAKIEKAISKKYGKEAIVNPKSLWNSEKEEKHAAAVKKFYEKNKKNKLLKREIAKIEQANTRSSCGTCSKFFLDSRDQIYMRKYKCCSECFINFVEDREERWLNGWRPDKQEGF